jgi:hypothetical protein
MTPAEAVIVCIFDAAASIAIGACALIADLDSGCGRLQVGLVTSPRAGDCPQTSHARRPIGATQDR